MGLIGFGGVGRRLAEVLAPFNTTIIATDLYPSRKPSYVDTLWPADRLNDLLTAAHVVILCLPLNDQTRDMFDAERLKMLRPGALFVNVARGGLVVTDDLVDALRKESFAGAVLDVTNPEPLPADHPLWNCPNVIITPHVGGQFYRRFDNIVDLFLANVRRWNNGQALINFLTLEGKELGFPIRDQEYPLWIDVKSSMKDDDINCPSTETELIPSHSGSVLPEMNSQFRFETTTYLSENVATRAETGQGGGCSPELKEKYDRLLDMQTVYWNEDIHFKKLLGKGGQGMVFLSERRTTDGFNLPLAIKVFSPERFLNDLLYEEEMAYMAMISARVARIQQDHLLTVHNWRSTNRIRFVEMEWVDGIDLSLLLRNNMLEHLRKRVTESRWNHINNVVVTRGPAFPCLKPGIAMPIIRDCLGALGALHREGIVHGDIKPSNIMIKRTGNAKVVDIGSAFLMESRPSRRPFTLAYAAPEVLEGKEVTPRSDLASLGYVLIEMLSGRRLFTSDSEFKGLDGRLFLPSQLPKVLPPGVANSEKLVNFCKNLIAPDPNKRFENGDAADLVTDGAAAFLRQLVLSNLSCEAESEIRNWLDDLADFDKMEMNGLFP